MVKLFKEIADSFYAMCKKAPSDYSNLETTIGERTFVYRDQSMATVIEYTGIKRVSGSDETDALVDNLAKTLNAFFAKECHEIQFVLDRDLMSKEQMQKRIEAVYASADALGMGDVIGDILDEQAQTMSSLCMNDTILIVLYTNTRVLRKEDYQDWAKEIVERRKKGEFYIPKGTQDETYAVDPMLALHDSFVDQVFASLTDSDTGALCRVLKVGEATNKMRRLIDPRGTSPQWEAWCLPETAEDVRKRFGTRRDNEALTQPSPPSVLKEFPKVKKVGNPAIYFPPPLAEQLIPNSAHYVDGGLEIGGRIYSTVTMVTAPRREVTAQQLTYTLSQLTTRNRGQTRRVPYRLSLRLRGCGLTQVATRAMIAPLFSVGSTKNRKIYKAYAALQKEKDEDFAMGTISLSLTTWADIDEPYANELVKSRVVAIRSAASQWGDMTVAEDVIDRMKTLVAACPGLSNEPCSNEATGNLYEVLPLIPWMRPASPLGNKGTEFYRSLDGALLPTAAHSSEQDFWLETITAPMGGGKSAQANRKHFDFIFAPGRKTLPFLHVLDIGGSVAGIIYLIQDALPPDQKHLVLMHTLRNNAENSVNMLDPKLGLRYPLEADAQVTVEFLTALATPAERSTPPDNMSEFCKAILDATYRRFDDMNDSGSPHRYEANTGDPETEAIEAALHDANIDISSGTPWYQIADRLAAVGKYREALLAHRRAVPTLQDLLAVAKDPNVRAEFMKAVTEQGMPIPEAFDTQMMLAASSFPIFFSGPTKLDLRGRRVTAIDLQEVTGKGSAASRKRANLMYMVAYELFAKNIRITEDDLPHIPPVWRSYYRDELEELKNTEKHVTIDEYHRTKISEESNIDPNAADASGIRATLVREGGRESRKWQLSLTTISQLSSDHGLLFGLASANHIIKRGSKEETAYQAKTMGLSATDLRALELFVNGPKKGVGVTFLSQWITKAGTFNQLFTSSIGPKFLWSLSSVYEDKAIRQIVYEALGRQNGRAALAKMFPGGSAKEEVERRKLEVAQGIGKSSEDALAGASRLVAQAVIEAYRRNPADYH